MANNHKDDLRNISTDVDAPLRPGQEWVVELARKDGRMVLSFAVAQNGKKKTYRTDNEKQVALMAALLGVLKDTIDLDFKYAKKLKESP